MHAQASVKKVIIKRLNQEDSDRPHDPFNGIRILFFQGIDTAGIFAGLTYVEDADLGCDDPHHSGNGMIADGKCPGKGFIDFCDGKGFDAEKELQQGTPYPCPVPGKVVSESVLNNRPDLVRRSHGEVLTTIFI
jgi:hypothetical protein